MIVQVVPGRIEEAIIETWAISKDFTAGFLPTFYTNRFRVLSTSRRSPSILYQFLCNRTYVLAFKRHRHRKYYTT